MPGLLISHDKAEMLFQLLMSTIYPYGRGGIPKPFRNGALVSPHGT